MATVSGKIFQVKDGTTNLFPRTVIEAVYGLDKTIADVKTWVGDSFVKYSTISNPTSTVDLDDQYIAGNRIQQVSWNYSTASNVANRPTTSGSAASVLVLPNVWGGLQFYTDYNSNTYYIRNRYSTTGWEPWVQLYHTGNFNPANYLTTSAASSTYAKLGMYNNLMHSGNEFTFASAGYNGAIHINYRTASGVVDGNISSYHFRNAANGYAYTYAAGYAIPNGTSSQFLKADGGVDSTAYLPLTGGTMSLTNYGSLTIKTGQTSNLYSYVRYEGTNTSGENKGLGYLGFYGVDTPAFMTVAGQSYALYHKNNLTQSVVTGLIGTTTYAPYNSSGYLPLAAQGLTVYRTTSGQIVDFNNSKEANVEAFFTISSNGTRRNAVGWNTTYGTYIYNYASAKYLGIKPDGTPHYHGNTLWHAGNANLSTVDWNAKNMTVAGTIAGAGLVVQGGADAKIIINNTDSETNYQYISFRQNNTQYGYLGTLGDDVLKWSGSALSVYKLRITTKHSSSSKAGGIYYYDGTTDYLLIGQGSSNLWIGANETAGTHHTGSTYISTGGVANLFASKLVGGTRTNAVILDALNYYGYPAHSLRDYNYHDGSHRRTAGNITFADGALHYYLATSSMTDSGRPGRDGHILHCAWDNSTWDTQMYIPDGGIATDDNAHVKVRGQNGQGSWNNWHTLYDDVNLNKSQIINIMGTFPEAYLGWGGRNYAGSFGPLDAAMVSELGANRFAFARSGGIVVEYSTDGGSTWTDYGAGNDSKTALFSNGSSFTTGKNSTAGGGSANNMLRVTLRTGAAQIYTVLYKFVIYCSTQGSSGSYCTIRCRTQQNYENNVDTWVTVADHVSIAGDSGYNVINYSTGVTTYGNTAASQYGEWQFIFGYTGFSGKAYGLTIYNIWGYGGVGWTTPSTMAKTGHLYGYDSNQVAYFPSSIIPATNGNDLGGASYRWELYATSGDFSSTVSAKHAIYANRYNGQGNVAGASIVINKSGDYFGIGPHNSTLSLLAFGSTSDTTGTWKTIFGSINDSGKVAIGTTPSTAFALRVYGGILAETGITTPNAIHYAGIDTGGTARGLMKLDSNLLMIGNGSSAAGYPTYIDGGTFIRFRIGTGHGTLATMTSSGLGINTTSPTQALDVVGSTRITGKLILPRENGPDSKLAWWNGTYRTWITYVSGVSGSTSPTGAAITSGELVTSWSLRSLIQNATGYGWVWESSAESANAASTIMMELSANTGVLRVKNGIYSNGYVSALGTASSSDAKLKDDITTISYDRAKEVLFALNPREWTWNALTSKEGERGAGMVAQEVESILPDTVKEIGGNLTLEYNTLFAYGLAMTKYLVPAVESLEERVARLERENEELKRQLTN